MDEYLDFSGDDFGAGDYLDFSGDDFGWLGDISLEDLGPIDTGYLDFSGDDFGAEDIPSYGIQDMGAQMPTSGPLVDPNDPFGSTWQTSGSDRIEIRDDGTGIGYNTETDASYGLTAEQIRDMLANGQLNTSESGYNTVTGGNATAPGGGTRIVDANGKVSYRMPDGRIINETAGGTLTNRPADATRPPGTSAKPGEMSKDFDWKKLLPLLLLALASRGGGGSSNQAVIPNLSASRKQTPYSNQFPAGRRPGSNAIRYFQEPANVQYQAQGGIVGLASGGSVEMYSPYMEGLAKPETIPRFPGETVEQARARVQGYQDELERRVIARAVTRNKAFGGPPPPESVSFVQTPSGSNPAFLMGNSPAEAAAKSEQLKARNARAASSLFSGVQGGPTPATPTKPAAPVATTPAPAPAGTPMTRPFTPDTDNSALIQQTDYAAAGTPYRPGQGGRRYFKPVQYGQTQNMAAGGGIATLGSYAAGGRGRLVNGPGDGVSDHVPATIDGEQPARIARGEYVIPARVVAELGNGSTEAGAEVLDALMDRIEAAGRQAGRGEDSGAADLLNNLV